MFNLGEPRTSNLEPRKFSSFRFASFFRMGNTLLKSSKSSYKSQIIDRLGDEEKYIQALTGFVSFGIFKFIVWPYLKDLNEMRK
ncbi:hypothetical protein DAPPUDRAFT_326636 [Daphnia pulex]|uniref:Uncharacterized protein n=1 Tax=Daphnia pulex TaxID=6669 RepID=E9H8B3_DAPPU|nr:hypothetical protein DAPPUDRAFT_326636 [Daphnia pulex]|eukprot:EFX72039.1 hypothetical protein DAPPUDRAFT_326636 [Daphnia pulex]